MNKTLSLATALALGALSLPAFGQGYLRAELGSSDTQLRYDGFRGSESDTVVSFGGGYWFHPGLAVEGHVASLYNEDLGYDTELDLVSLGVGLAAKHNFGPEGTGFFLGARAGIARLTAQIREDTWDVVDDESSTRPYYGVSLGYDINRRWGLSLNLDRREGRFDGVSVQVDTIALGGEFRF